MQSEQRKERRKRRISGRFFIFALMTQSPASIIPSPSTIAPTKRKVPEKAGGAAAASAEPDCRWVSRASIPIPASRNPTDCIGKKTAFSFSKSQSRRA